MESTGRRYLCAACRAAVLICSHCDRGQRYCAAGCAQATVRHTGECGIAGDPCGGLLGQAEVALAALAATHDARYHLASQAIGRALWLRRQAHGTWFPETFAADCHNLGAINGIAAVAHLFIRLDNPAAAGSLRLLA